MQFRKTIEKLSLNKFDFLTIIYVFLFAILLYIFSNGDIRGSGSDFYLYFKPIKKIFDSNCQNIQCLQYLIPKEDLLKDNWIPTPFYSLTFLIPITIFNSDELFLLQGLIITFSIIFLLRKLIFEFYESKLTNNLLSFAIFLGTLNYAFLRDSLTSGTTSLCFLFILLAINFRLKFSIVVVMIFLSAITRSNFIFIDFSFIFALAIFKPKNHKRYLIYSIIGFFLYLIQYKLFYHSYPGSPYIGLFKTGSSLVQDNNIIEFFKSRLPLGEAGLFRWSPTFKQIISLMINDLSLTYGVIVLYFFKIMNTLGFMHTAFFIDNREIWIQRLMSLLYFIFILAPSFYISCFTIAFQSFFRTNFINSWEITILATSVIYVLTHSLYLGGIRYLTGFHFIFIFSLIRTIMSLKKLMNVKQTPYIQKS